jgi:FXSXX-COOH protein
VDDSVARNQGHHPARSSDLIDLGGLSLTDLSALDDSVVAHSLRRILEESAQPDDAVAGFQSAI